MMDEETAARIIAEGRQAQEKLVTETQQLDDALFHGEPGGVGRWINERANEGREGKVLASEAGT